MVQKRHILTQADQELRARLLAHLDPTVRERVRARQIEAEPAGGVRMERTRVVEKHNGVRDPAKRRRKPRTAKVVQASAAGARLIPIGLVGSTMHGQSLPLSLPTRRAHRSLRRYNERGGGMDLFEAYLYARGLLRPTDGQRTAPATRLSRLSELSNDEFQAAMAELDVFLRVLDELDPVVEDLMRVCLALNAREKLSRDEQLSRLREALRIDAGRAPSDSRRERQKERVRDLWFAAYVEMRKSKQYKSENAIADEIAGSRLSRRTVLNYWDEAKGATSWLRTWADEIAQAARATPSRRTRKDGATAARPAKTPPKLRRLEYGKKKPS